MDSILRSTVHRISLVKATVYASSLKNNKLATLEETENARTELAAALQEYSTKPEPEKDLLCYSGSAGKRKSDGF